MAIIGLDFDNTIVSYDEVFHRAAVEQRLIEPSVGRGKQAVRDHLRAAGAEDAWTRLQGYVYGPGMALARPYAGAIEFIGEAIRAGHELRIISHRSLRPYLGPAYDLHQAARDFLQANGFFDPGGAGLRPEHALFLPELGDKLAAIAGQGCHHFVDDLPEALGDPRFPAGVRRILFDPDRSHPVDDRWSRAENWAEVGRLLDIAAT